MRPPRRGLSTIELIVAMAVMAVLLTLVARNLRIGALSRDTVETLGRLQELRLAQRKLQAALEGATGILAPAVGTGGPVLVYADRVNLPHLVYLDPQGTLWDMPRGEAPVAVARELQDFQASQPFAEQAELRLVALPRGEEVPPSMVVTAYAGNHFYGEVGSP